MLIVQGAASSFAVNASKLCPAKALSQNMLYVLAAKPNSSRSLVLRLNTSSMNWSRGESPLFSLQLFNLPHRCHNPLCLHILRPGLLRRLRSLRLSSNNHLKWRNVLWSGRLYWLFAPFAVPRSPKVPVTVVTVVASY